jgi:hypothetical protein
VFLHDHIPPGDKQQTPCWPQFGDIVSPHRHEQHKLGTHSAGN